MKTTSIQPRKQHLAAVRRNHINRLRAMSAHLSDELLKEYSLRSITVRKGDTVKVVRGSYKDHVGKVVKVFPQRGFITIEGATRTKIDNKTVPLMFRPSKVVITKLDLSDPWRREKLQRFKVAEGILGRETGEVEKKKVKEERERGAEKEEVGEANKRKMGKEKEKVEEKEKKDEGGKKGSKGEMEGGGEVKERGVKGGVEKGTEEAEREGDGGESEIEKVEGNKREVA
ncbi:MAG: 50S ribosomal protein L24 [Thermoplasmata archaeon]